MKLKIIKMPAGRLGANSYIVYSENTRQGIVIDPGGDADLLLKKIEENNLDIEYIVLTHGHGDHIGGVEGLETALDAKVLVHKEDAEMISNPEINLSKMIGLGDISLKADRKLSHGDVLEIGDLKFHILHTPGHTRGGISLKAENYLFTGDTLFQGSIGRTDLIGGDYKTLIDSIKREILTLEDDIIILPGHGENTTVGQEKKINPYLR